MDEISIMAAKSATQENARELAVRVAIEEETRRRTDPNESHEKSLIVLGSKEVGKTTMIYRFLEKEDSPKQTIAMDYSYGRKAGKSLVKDVVHVWEIGHLDAALITAAMSGCSLTHSPHHTTVLVVLDLSEPELLWNSLDDCLTALRSAMKASYTAEQIEDLRQQRLKALQERKKSSDNNAPPPEASDPFPLRLCIIGGKYDEFRQLEMVDREFIGQLLRAAAHVLGASLHYHTAKDSQILRKTKELLSLHGFKGQPTKNIATDYEKPLSIPAGGDSYESIDLRISYDRFPTTLTEIKHIYVTRFPQRSGKDEREDEDRHLDPKDPLFSEPIIDRLCSQREQEISVLLRDMLESPATAIPIPEPY